MTNYLQYDIDDFVWDESFRQWVLSPTRENDSDWQQWLAEHPEKIDTIQRARTLVLALQESEPNLSEDEIKYTVLRTLGRIKKKQAQEASPLQPEPKIIPLYRKAWFQAAVLVLIVGISFITWESRLTTASKKARAGVSYQQLINSKTLTETVNNSVKSMPVKLSDGSLVILKPSSRLSYSRSFNGLRREVYLLGEGFFEVTKNPDKPFLIYANGLITKVLGTSFIIKAYPADKDVTVEVKTGRVAVFAQSEPGSVGKTKSRDLKGMLLTPNQKIVYSRDEVSLSKSLVDTPQLITKPKATYRFEFEETPVPAVFDALEKAYEIDLVYDESLLANCPLTATLTDQPLFEKLDIICRVIEAHYEVMDGKIIIYSRGCKP